MTQQVLAIAALNDRIRTEQVLLAEDERNIALTEARRKAGAAAIGVATARLYPAMTIGATLTQTASSPGKIFNPSATGFDIFGGIMASIFDGGTRKADIRSAIGAVNALECVHGEESDGV